MEGLRNIPGFLGTGASLLADITLVVEILFFIMLCLGVTAQLWHKYKWHDRLQAPVVLLNLFFIGLVMIPTFFAVLSGGITQIPGVVLIHAGLGLLAELVAIYCLLAGFKILPRKIGVLRYFMWTAFVLWTLAVLFGVALYISFYTGASAESATVSEHAAELTGEHAAVEVETAAPSPPAEPAAEHAEDLIAAEPTVLPPAVEPIEEHAAEPVEAVEEQVVEPAEVTVEPTSEPAPVPVRAGLLTLSDGEVHSDKVTLALTGVTPPPDGSVYEAWLTGEGQAPLSLGTLTIVDGIVNHTFTDPQGRNLLGFYNGMFISLEPANDTDSAPAEGVAYQGEIPATVLEQVRLAVTASPNTPDGESPALRALNQILKIEPEVGFQKDYSIPNNDLAALKIQAEGIINIIEGQTGPNYGDADGNGEIYDQGDGFGLLGSGDGAGYLQMVINTASATSQAEGASPEVALRAEQTQLAAQNAIGWLEELRDLELQILNASNTASQSAAVTQVAELMNRLNDAAGVGLTDATRGGIRAMYTYSQLMGAMEVFAAASPPTVPAAEPVPELIDEHAAESVSEHDGN